MKQHLSHISKISGKIFLPGDKSISHRALILSALAKGKSSIKNLAESNDVLTTINCLKDLNVKIQKSKDVYIIQGVGREGFNKSDMPLYCGNSGTTTRLLSGVLAAQDFPSVMTGDDSLSRRPMKRVIDPLEQMGCTIKSEDGKLPLHFLPIGEIKPIEYKIPIASAQVKGAVLLAGLHCKNTTTLIEDNLFTRDHTEIMLNLPFEIIGNKKVIKVSDSYFPTRGNYFIPGDVSTAAYFIVLTILAKNSVLLLQNVSLNERRTEFVDILKNMGAKISLTHKGESYNEPYGDIYVESSDLKNIEISTELIPAIIDEIPILSIAGAFAEGEFSIRGASELRIKESDRINSICSNLKIAGFETIEFSDGFSFDGKIGKGHQTFESFGDHRIAMAFSVLACLKREGSDVNRFECVSVSNPDFLNQLELIIA
ncbi:MAG: 3-phosphoshikimate 1-carboxyvinyltransferase [Ignavibacteria bacterium]|nr:3-phosphoshikimate 1-carboxyvinyltransferase [Ignavibacteria bacterium]